MAYCVLRWKSAHSSENSAAKKRTFRKKGVILFLACGGQKVQFPDAKTCTFRRKGVILPTACCGEKVHMDRKFGGERAHIPKKKCDFAFCLLWCESALPGCKKCHIPQTRSNFSYSVLRRKSADIAGDVGFCLLVLVAKCGFGVFWSWMKSTNFRCGRFFRREC